ncbi:MAG TPA: ATP-binding protein [Bryobacteraceae bacterium]|nr:ATP-binding protein [Bryobacteraceae bacterium]
MTSLRPARARLWHLSLLWKILLSTSIALTALFAVIGAIMQNNASRALESSVEQEVQGSFQAYDSLWRSRAEMLASVSLVMSRMSDVRAAFGTGDAATIRDTASELWKGISHENAVFLVADPQGRVIASLGGTAGGGPEPLGPDLPVVRQAAPAFPRQASGFMMAGGRLYQIAVTPVYVQSGADLALLDVLVAGYVVDGAVARSLRDSTGGSDFCFLAGGRVIASTLDPAAAASVGAAAASPGNPQRIEAGDTEYTMLATTLAGIDGQPLGELRILRSFENTRRNIMRLARNIVLIWVIAVLVGLLLTYSLARRILEPVKALDRGAAEVARGNYGYRISAPASGVQNIAQSVATNNGAPGGSVPNLARRAIDKKDELGRLAEAFDAMCAAIQESRRELIRQERIATIGRLSTSIVHDLRNPLAAIYGGAEMLMDEQLSSAQVQRLAGNIYRSSRRMQQLLQELVDTGRGRGSGAEMCRLREVVAAAYEVYAPAADAQAVAVRIQVPEEIELPLERARMERVFLNLIDNALGAMPAGGRLEIAAESSGQSVVVRVEDTGTGIAPEVRSELFHPFVTAGKKNGVGLGLAFSHQTVVDHGGELWADPSPGPGAKFFIRLPLTAPSAAV